jgi:hypothetical protein
VNTASELEHLHVGETPKRAALDKAIIDQTLRIRRAQQAWQASKDVKQEHALRMLLSRDAPFTALMRAEFHELSALFD